MRTTIVRIACVSLSLIAVLFGSVSPLVAQQTTPPEPTLPDPVPVTLNPSTTALLVMDLFSTSCGVRPACVTSLAPIASLLQQARDAGVMVIETATPSASPDLIMPQVAPLPTEPIVIAGADKFYGTNLADLLTAANIDTLILVGTSSNGAVLYTAFAAATERGYTVVVPEDGMSAADPFATFVTEYQLLNQSGSANPLNVPLLHGAVTLTMTSQITLDGGM